MRILLIDDDQAVRQSICDFLTYELGHEVIVCESVDKAEGRINSDSFPLVVSDILMTGKNGIDLVKDIKGREDGVFTEIILLTGYANTDLAIEALRAGAFDFLKKPINIRQLAETVRKVQIKQETIRSNPEAVIENNFQQEESSKLGVYQDVPGIGRIAFFCEKMKKNLNLAFKLYHDRSIATLIQGETGTGKEIFARLIHNGDHVDDRPFISVNCSAIPESLFESELFGYEAGSFTGALKQGKAGKFEMANGGTIFLDEIGDMPLMLQPKILKVLQDKELSRIGSHLTKKLDVRVICATNRDLNKDVGENKFRADLYYRINNAKINLPSLRERRDEIVPLTKFFLKEMCLSRKRNIPAISVDTYSSLQNYNWPGNVRQLSNAISRVLLLNQGEIISPASFDFLADGKSVAAGYTNRVFSFEIPTQTVSLYDVEELFVRHVLMLMDGNKSKTAQFLQISQNKLRRMLKEM